MAGPLLVLAGCTAPAPAPGPLPVAAAPPPVAAPAGGSSSVDGLYDGTSTRYLAQRRDCPHPGLVSIYVQGGQFTYRWDRDTDVPATVEPDGTVSGQDGPIQLTGKVDGSEMIGDLNNGSCALHFTVRRKFRGA